MYSLGVLLYELLTGTRPFDFRTLLEAGFAEVLRTIREVDPPKPSTRVSTLGEQLASVAKQRRMHPRALGPLMRGDLDWIVMRTLEKERNRRYATPAALAEDVQRYLRDEPVEAGPPSRLYRLRKYVQRHRLGVGAGAAIALSVVAGGAAAGWGWVRAREEAHISRVEATKAATLVVMLEEMLGSSNPKHFHGPDYTVRQLLEDYEAELAGELENEPEVEVQLRRTMAKTFLDLGLLEQAAAQARRIRELLAMLPGASAAPTPADLIIEANVCSANGRYAEALSLLEALDARPGEPDCSEEMLSRASNIRKTCQVNLGQFEQARQTIREALEIQRRKANDDGVVHAMIDLAELDTVSGRLESANQAFREVALLVERGEYFPCVEVHYQLGHAKVLRLLLRGDEAVQLAERGLARSRELYGDSALDTAQALLVTGLTLDARGDVAAAAGRLEEAWKIYSAVLGESHPETASCLNELAGATTDLDTAEHYARQVLEIDLQAGREDSVIGADHKLTLAGILVKQERHAEAEAAVLAALAVFREKLAPQDSQLLGARFVLASIAHKRGALDEAERLLQELLPGLEANAPLLAEASRILGRVMLDKGAPAEAVVHFNESLAVLRHIAAPPSSTEAWTMHDLADAQWKLGERSEARRLNADSRAMFAVVGGPDSPDIAETAECLAGKLTAITELEEAQGLLLEAVRIRIAVGQPAKAAENRHRLGHVLSRRKDPDGAEREFIAGLDLLHGAGGKESHLGAEFCIDLGVRRTARGDAAGGAHSFREALGIALRIGAKPENISVIRTELASALEKSGDLASAEQERRELVELHRGLREDGNTGENLASMLAGLAGNLGRQKRYAEAEPLLWEALVIDRSGEDNVRIASTLARLGGNLLEQQRAPEAVPLLEECLDLRVTHSPDDWKRYEAASLLGAAYLACGDRDRAEPLMVEAANRIQPPASSMQRRRDAIERLIALYEATERPDDAATWRKALDELAGAR